MRATWNPAEQESMLLSLSPHLESWRKITNFQCLESGSAKPQQVHKTGLHFCPTSFLRATVLLPPSPPPFCVPVPPLRPCCWLVADAGTCPYDPEGAHQAAKDSPMRSRWWLRRLGSPDTPSSHLARWPQTLLWDPQHWPCLLLSCWFFFSFSDSAILHIITITNDLHWVA